LDKITTDSLIYIDGRIGSDWQFEESLLDTDHCVCVALHRSGDRNVNVEDMKCQMKFEHLENISEILSGLKPFSYQESKEEWTDYLAKYKNKAF
jgi:hypothetical protein